MMHARMMFVMVSSSHCLIGFFWISHLAYKILKALLYLFRPPLIFAKYFFYLVVHGLFAQNMTTGIDSISEEVVSWVLVAIHLKSQAMALPRNKLATNWDLSWYIYVIIPPSKARKCMPNLQSWFVMASRMILQLLSLFWNCPCQATGQFFHIQYMQSTLPNVHGKPYSPLIITCFTTSK